MKPIFYLDPFARQTPFGTGRYAFQLYAAMQRQQPGIDIRPVSAWTDRDAAGIRELEERYNYRKLPFDRKVIGSAWAFLKRPYLEHVLREPFDLLHMLEVTYPVPTKRPLVATVHDIMPLTNPEYLSNSRPWLIKMGLKYVLKRAEAIICVSQATADALKDYFQCDPGERLHVIHEGAAPHLFNPPESNALDGLSGLPPAEVPIILTTGAISQRKNMVRVVEALESIADKVPHHLVHVGNSAWETDTFEQKVRTSPIRERIHLPGYLTDAQLHALYHRAQVYAYCSLLEGFGLPLLEAMASGCAIVTSSHSSMPEIAGDAALQVDAFSVESIAEGLLRVCRDETLANGLREKGRERVKSFSWDTCAAQTLAVYQKAMGGA